MAKAPMLQGTGFAIDIVIVWGGGSFTEGRYF